MRLRDCEIARLRDCEMTILVTVLMMNFMIDSKGNGEGEADDLIRANV